MRFKLVQVYHTIYKFTYYFSKPTNKARISLNFLEKFLLLNLRICIMLDVPFAFLPNLNTVIVPFGGFI